MAQQLHELKTWPGCVRGPEADRRERETLLAEAELRALVRLHASMSVEHEGRSIESCARHVEHLQRLLAASYGVSLEAQ